MRIDSHQHFWKYNPVRDNWIDETMGDIRRDFLPLELKPVLDENNIDGCIAVQADQSEEETIFLLNSAEDNSFIKGVVGWVDLCADNLENRLEYFSKFKKFCGVRHIVQAEPINFMMRQEFQTGISLLKKFKLTYDILIIPSQIRAAIELVKNFPDQPFVLDHMAKPNIKHGEIKSWKQDIEILALYQNVHCKISGLFTEADWKIWLKSDFTKYLDVIFCAFGVNRILFGSDWPVCLLAVEYKEQLEIVKEYISKFTVEEQSKIMGENAIRFYNLKV